MSLSEVNRSSVLHVMEEFDLLGRDVFLAKYGFGPARAYFLVEGDRMYDSRAIVGAAHQFTSARKPLTSAEFSGGDRTVARLLSKLGFRVVRDPDRTVNAASNSQWDLAVGETIQRVQLHQRFGGSRQDGVSPSTETPNVLIFTDPRSGEQHGYYDRWREDDYFYYTGRGQRGDQTFTSGNLGLLQFWLTFGLGC